MDYKDYEAGISGNFFWFKARTRLISILLDKLKIGGGIKILDVGGGTGEDISLIEKYGDVYVIDINRDALNLVPDELVCEKKICDARSIQYPDNFFDVVVAFDVLEHIEDDSLAVKEIGRVLKEKGVFVFTVPAFNVLFSAHDRELGHRRRYSKKSVRDILLGYDCMELGFWQCFLFIPVAIQRLLNKKSNAKIHHRRLPKLINNILYNMLNIENYLIEHKIPLPIGTTIYGIFQVKKS